MISTQKKFNDRHQRKEKILIVDDTLENLRLLNLILRGEEYTVLSAQNGSLALEYIKNSIPDLIILDIKMPGMDGYETCSRLKADKRVEEVPVVFLSAFDESAGKVKGLKLGAVDYISIPFDIDEFLARIKIHLAIQNRKKS